MQAVKKKIDFTRGKVFGKILLFVLPIIATNLLQTFYNAADMMVVGLSSEANAKAAIGMTNAMITLVINMLIGFSVGTNVVVARAIGSKDEDRTRRAVHTSIIMSLIFGLVTMALGLIVARPVLSWMGAKENLLDLAVTYTSCYFLGVPFMAMTNYLCSIFRAKGDSKTPLIVLSLSGVLNVVFNLFFVLVCGLSVEGVAIATAIANLASAVVLLLKLSRAQDATKLSLKKLKLHRGAFRDILIVGFPAGIQGALFSLSNVFIQSSVIRINNAIVPEGSLYQPVVDGHAAMGSLDGFVYTAMNAVSQGAITFTSQNMGANKPERVRRIMWSSFGLVTLVGVIMSGIMTIFFPLFISLYGLKDGAVGSLEHIAYQTAFIRCLYICLPYFLCGVMECATAVLRGLGKSLESAVITLVGACLLRIVWLVTVFEWTFVGNLDSLKILYSVYPISQFTTALFTFFFIESLVKKFIKRKRSKRRTR